MFVEEPITINFFFFWKWSLADPIIELIKRWIHNERYSQVSPPTNIAHNHDLEHSELVSEIHHLQDEKWHNKNHHQKLLIVIKYHQVCIFLLFNSLYYVFFFFFSLILAFEEFYILN